MWLCFRGSIALLGQCLLNAEVSRSHSDTPHSVGLVWTSDRPRRRDLYLHNTQLSQQTDIHAIGGIRTRKLNNLAAADPRLRQRGHRERQLWHPNYVHRFLGGACGAYGGGERGAQGFGGET